MYNLTEQEKLQLILLNQNETMMEAIKKVLLTNIYSNGVIRLGQKADPSRNGALGLASLAVSGRAVITDADLGADVRAFAHAVALIENGYYEIAKFKEEEKKVESPYNEAI